jgi:hypothetical protein
MSETPVERLTLKAFKEYFEADCPNPRPGGADAKVTMQELKALKKDADGNVLPDYDQLEAGIRTGTLTY